MNSPIISNLKNHFELQRLKPILFVLQSQESTPGRTTNILQKLGFPLEACYPLNEQSLPSDLSKFAGIIIFGGSMSANDEHKLPGIQSLLNWVPQVIKSQIPLLGICLGAQLIAKALGATVAEHPLGVCEIGYYSIDVTDAGQEFCPAKLPVYHWHFEGFQLPAGATLLATNSTFPNQAFRYRQNVFGLQFHPEVDKTVLERWLATPGNDLNSPGAQTSAQQQDFYLQFDNQIEIWFEAFLKKWLSL